MHSLPVEKRRSGRYKRQKDGGPKRASGRKKKQYRSSNVVEPQNSVGSELIVNARPRRLRGKGKHRRAANQGSCLHSVVEPQNDIGSELIVNARPRRLRGKGKHWRAAEQGSCLQNVVEPQDNVGPERGCAEQGDAAASVRDGQATAQGCAEIVSVRDVSTAEQGDAAASVRDVSTAEQDVTCRGRCRSSRLSYAQSSLVPRGLRDELVLDGRSGGWISRT